MTTAIRVSLAAACFLFMTATIAVSAPPLTAADAERFLDDAQKELSRLGLTVNRASWVANNFITVDTQYLSAQASEALIGAAVRLAKEAARFDAVELPAATRRDLLLLKGGLVSPAPSDPEKTAAVATLAAKRGRVRRGKVLPETRSLRGDPGSRPDLRAQPRSQRAPRHLGGMALDLTAHAPGLPALHYINE